MIKRTSRRRVSIAATCLLAFALAGAVLALRSPSDTPPRSALARVPPAEPGESAHWRAGLAGDDDAFRAAARLGLAREPSAVMEALLGMDGFAERTLWALSLWLEADFASARGWAEGREDVDGAALARDAFDLFAGRDPVAALAAVESLHWPADRVDFAARALRAWAREDPATAWLAAQDFPLPGDELAAQDFPLPGDEDAPFEALHWSIVLVAGQGDWKRRRGRLSTAVLDVWSQHRGWREPLTAVAATEGAHVPSTWQAEAVARWAEAEPLAALAWASSLPRSDAADRVAGVQLRRDALGAVLATMAVHWPHKANAAMEEIGDRFARYRQHIYNSPDYRRIIRRFVETTVPLRVVAWFDNQPDTALRIRHADDVARAYASAHPQDALEWARERTEGLARIDAVWAAITAIVDDDHARAAEMLLDLGDPYFVEHLTTRLRASWVKEDPLAAVRWSDLHAPKEWSAERRMSLFHAWARTDPAAAAAYLPRITGADERAWATHHAINGTSQAARDDDALRPHLPRLERLYATLPREARSKHVAYFLFRHYEHADPERAAMYKEEAGDDHGDPWNFSGIHPSR